MPGRGTRQQLTDRIAELERKVDLLTEGVEEGRRLNERLSDVIDVVTEVLVPAIDRDDARLRAALARLDQTLA